MKYVNVNGDEDVVDEEEYEEAVEKLQEKYKSKKGKNQSIIAS